MASASQGGKLKWLIIGGAAALALLFLGVAVPGAMWALGWFGGDDQQVVQENGAKTEEPAAANVEEPATGDTEAAAGRDDEGGIAGRDDEGSIAGRDDEGSIAGRDDEGVTSGAADEGTAAAAGDDPAPASTDGADPAGDTVVGPAEGGGEAGNPPKDGSEDEAWDDLDPEKPKPGTAESPTPDAGTSGEDAAEQPKPAEDPPKETAEPPKENPPKETKDPPKPPPKAKEPFRNFKPTMNLLAADAEGGANPQALAAVDVAPEAIWFVSLVGGDDIGKGKRLKINSNGQDGHKARWTMDMETPGVGQREATTATVGELWYENGNLMFQWNKDAGNVPEGTMQSCLIQIDVESDSRTLGFIEPKMVEPLLVDIQKKPLPVKIEFEKLPGLDKLKFEITRLEGIKEKTTFEPNGPVAVRTPVNLQIMLTDAFNNLVPGLAFQFNMTATRGSIMITHRLTGSVGDLPAVRQMGLRFPLPADGRNIVVGKITELEEKMKGRQGQGLQGDERTQVQEGIRFGKMVVWFDDFVKNSAGPSKIHYRIFMDVGGKQIDLVRTEAAQPEGGGKDGGKKE